eukprot:NODE_1016_length_1095_cov_93.652008_g705_i0.p3 GENE.NODE_1016_length_1095_cov_93.652008_g705_i0~~NODE_1016_length_1095_cov_93.652008_g705_i0.p3  ORF type:complete len:77 (-),score=22.22 NODE_1016_length_1095_cov_93.652008_g705_i0:863-1069(-)
MGAAPGRLTKEVDLVDSLSSVAAYIASHGITLCICGSQGHGPVYRAIYGSFTTHLLEECLQTAVLVVH